MPARFASAGAEIPFMSGSIEPRRPKSRSKSCRQRRQRPRWGQRWHLVRAIGRRKCKNHALAGNGVPATCWSNENKASAPAPAFVFVHPRNWTFSLWRAVSGNQAGLADEAFGPGRAQAGRLEIRPGLFGAAAADGMDVEPVALGERLRHAGFDLRGKSGKNGEGGSGERCDTDRRKRFDHDGPLCFGGLGPFCRPGVFFDELVTTTGFGMPSRIVKNGFIPMPFCFVRWLWMKQSRYLQREDAPTPPSVRSRAENKAWLSGAWRGNQGRLARFRGGGSGGPLRRLALFPRSFDPPTNTPMHCVPQP